jgi:hypothetical protein
MGYMPILHVAANSGEIAMQVTQAGQDTHIRRNVNTCPASALSSHVVWYPYKYRTYTCAHMVTTD